MPLFEIFIDSEVVRKQMGQLSEGKVLDEAAADVSRFLQKEVQKQPPKKSVSRKEAYGVTFFSQRQRRFFFAALRQGTIQVPYRRTDRLRKDWLVERFGAGDYQVINRGPYAHLVQAEASQSRMMRIIGWVTEAQAVRKNLDKIGRIANQAVDNFIRRIGL